MDDASEVVDSANEDSDDDSEDEVSLQYIFLHSTINNQMA